MKNQIMVFFVLCFLFSTTHASDAKQPYGKSSRCSSIAFDIKDPVLIKERKGKGIIFYVHPSIGERYHEDIKRAADMWNQHLPQDTQVHMAFSLEEWKAMKKEVYGFFSFFAQSPNTVIQSIEADPGAWHDTVRNATQGHASFIKLVLTQKIAHLFLPITFSIKSMAFINDAEFGFFSDQDSKEKIYGSYSMYRTVANIIGEAMGLGFSDSHESIMYPVRHTAGKQYERHAFTESDIQSIRCAYGMAPSEHVELPKLKNGGSRQRLENDNPPQLEHGNPPRLEDDRSFVEHAKKCLPFTAAVGLGASSLSTLAYIMLSPSKTVKRLALLPIAMLSNVMALQTLSSFLKYPSYETCEELVKELESMVPFVKELNGKLTATLQSPNGEEKLQMQCLVDEEASTDAYVNVLEETCTFKTIPQTNT